jgi:hypothetical protein
MSTKRKKAAPAQQLVIDAPIGYAGERIGILNYRMRPAVWEVGTIRDLTFRPGQAASSRSYPSWSPARSKPRSSSGAQTCKRSRRGACVPGGGHALTVGAESVRRLP